MSRLTAEERERLWDDYFNKRGDYAEPVSIYKPEPPDLCVDTQKPVCDIQEPIDFKALERAVTYKAIALIATVIFVLYLLSKLLG